MDWVGRLKYILVSGIYPPDIGGPATYLPKLAAKILEKGKISEVFTLADTKSLQYPSQEWKVTSVKRGLPKPLRSLSFILAIIRRYRLGDKFFANGMYEEIGLISLFGIRPSVAKIVGDPIWERYRNQTGSKIGISEFQLQKLSTKLLIQRKFLVWSLNRFERITTPSVELGNFVKSWGVKSPVKVIVNGVQCHKIKRSEPIYDVISVSRLVSWKNIDVLIKVCSNLNLKLAIVGTGPEQSALMELGKELNSYPDFLGELNHDQVLTALKVSKIFALVSDYEGLSFSLLEAMMSKCAIVVSDNPGNCSVISHGESGLIVRTGDQDEITQALSLLANDDNLRIRLGENASTFAKKNYCSDLQLDSMIAYIDAESR